MPYTTDQPINVIYIKIFNPEYNIYLYLLLKLNSIK